MENGEKKIYSFGPFKLSTVTEQLYRNGEVVRLQRKSYELLLILLENAGRKVEKAEIIDRVWADRQIDATNLTQQVYNLRRLLSENAKESNYIVTIPGRGYLFGGEVKVRIDNGEEPEGKAGYTEEEPDSRRLSGSGVEEKEGSNVTVEAGWRRGKVRRLVLWAVVVMVILAVVAGMMRQWRWRFSADAVPRVSPLVTLAGMKSFPALSRNGRELAFSWDGGEGTDSDIYVCETGGTGVRRLTTEPTNEIQVVWSPDGMELAFLREPLVSDEKFRVVTIPVSGGEARELGSASGGLDWSPDGQYLAISDSTGDPWSIGIVLIGVRSGERKAVTAPVAKGATVFDTFPRFSPDGKKIAFARFKNDSSADLFIVDRESGVVKQLSFDERRIMDLEWMPGGKEIFYVVNRDGGQRAWRVEVNGGVPRRVDWAPWGITEITISASNGLLACAQSIEDSSISIDEMGGVGNGNRERCQINSPRRDDSAAVSPDGREVAFVSSRTGADEIWIGSADCSKVRQVTSFRESGIGSPRWSPDGTRIAFDRRAGSETAVWMVDLHDGSMSRMTNDRSGAYIPSWSRDGKWIYFSAEDNGQLRIRKVPSTGGSSLEVTQNSGRGALESVDGRTLFFNNGNYLWRKDLVTGEEREVRGLEEIRVKRDWDVTAEYVYFATQGETGLAWLGRLSLVSGKVERVETIQGSLDRYKPAVSIGSEGRMIALSFIRHRLGDIVMVENWH